MNVNQEMSKIFKIIKAAHEKQLELWLNQVFLSWQWWLQLCLSVTPWVLWLRYRKKDSSHRLMYAGIFVMLVSTVFDIWGVSFGLWYYNWKLIPISVAIFPWNLSLIPVATMVTLQINPLKVNRYIKALVFACGASFIVEPIFVYFGFYVPVSWKHIYSFPIILGIYLTADLLSRRDQFARI